MTDKWTLKNPDKIETNKLFEKEIKNLKEWKGFIGNSLFIYKEIKKEQ